MSEYLRSKNNNVEIDGLVNYYSFSYSNNSQILKNGSVSKVYVQSLHSISLAFSYDFIIKIVSRIIPALDFIHSKNLVHCDIKPENLFIDSAGNVDLGDFGGMVEIGNNIIEYTPDYMPHDFIEVLASKLHDYYCLLSTIFYGFLKKPKSIVSTSILDGFVNGLENDGSQLKRILIDTKIKMLI